LGDSVVAARGDTDDANRYYGAAAVLRRIPVFDTITIVVDGAPMAFDAVALAVVDSGSATTCLMPPMDDDHDAGYECPWGFPRETHTLFAWQPDQPPHIVQLVASADSGAVGRPGAAPRTAGDSAAGDSATFKLRVPARLKYFSGQGGVSWGESGVQQNAVTPTTQPCPTPADSGTSADVAGTDREGHGWGGSHIDAVACRVAGFVFQMDAVVTPPPAGWAGSSNTGTHTIHLAPATVPGAYVVIGAPPSGR
jgi:hypothetical protein